MTYTTGNYRFSNTSSRLRTNVLLINVGFLVLMLGNVHGFSCFTRCRSMSQWPLRSSRNNGNGADDDMESLEREVMASTRARLDLKRVSTQLLGDDIVTTAPPSIGMDDDSVTTQQQVSSYYSPFAVALTAGGVAALGVFSAWHNLSLTAMTWLVVFLIANGDPLEEDSVAGALARVVGRITLRSVQASQPKVRAVARAAVRGEEDLIRLEQRVQELETENVSLRLWQQRRLYVDDALPLYTVEELKFIARANNLAVGGTKTQLLMRLVEANVIDITS